MNNSEKVQKISDDKEAALNLNKSLLVWGRLGPRKFLNLLEQTKPYEAESNIPVPSGKRLKCRLENLNVILVS